MNFTLKKKCATNLLIKPVALKLFLNRTSKLEQKIYILGKILCILKTTAIQVMRAMKPVMRIKVATNMVPTATGEFWCRLLGQHSMHKSNTAM